MEHYLVHVIQLLHMYGTRMATGPPLAEHEVCCYMKLCRLVEEHADQVADNMRQNEEEPE